MNGKFTPWIALGISIFTTIMLWCTVSNLEMQKNQSEFDAITDKIQHSIEEKLRQYSALISGAKGFFVASQLVEPAEWTSFVNAQNIKERFPGTQGLGFIRHIENEEDITSLLQFMSGYGIVDYQIKPEGKRDEYYPIMYLEPQDLRNKRAIGYDIYSEPTRRQAAEIAEVTGENTITGKIILIQETEEDIQFGFLMMQPIYEKEKPIQTEIERKNHIFGFVYAPFRMNDLMNATLDPSLVKYINLKIYDGKEESQNLLFAKDSISQNQDSARSKTTVLTFGGKTWTLVFHDFEPNNLSDTLLSNLILAAGSSMSILLFFVFYFINKNNILTQEKIKTERFTIIGELAARLAHDLRNPLSVIKISVDLMKMNLGNTSDEKTLHHVQTIDKSVTRMNALIDGTLNYVRTKQPKLSPESLSEIIRSSIANISHHDNVKIILPQNDITISCDKDQLLVVFNNLLLNSIQAMEDKEGIITISIHDKNDNVIINIEDSGPGIPDDVLPKIFDPLFTTKQHGTGLGLVSCKNIIEQHKGTISVKNNPTTFSIMLPKHH